MWDSKKYPSPVFPCIYKSSEINWGLPSICLHPLLSWTEYLPTDWVTLEDILLWILGSTNNPIYFCSKQSEICFEYLPFSPNMKWQRYCPFECILIVLWHANEKKLKLYTLLPSVLKHLYDLSSHEMSKVPLSFDLGHKHHPSPPFATFQRSIGWYDIVICNCEFLKVFPLVNCKFSNQNFSSFLDF